MEITGIISALFIGGIVGALGRMVVPGRQQLSLLMTILIGIAAALVGTLLAGAFGFADTSGIDWLEIALQVGVAGAAVTTISSAKSHKA